MAGKDTLVWDGSEILGVARKFLDELSRENYSTKRVTWRVNRIFLQNMPLWIFVIINTSFYILEGFLFFFSLSSKGFILGPFLFSLQQGYRPNTPHTSPVPCPTPSVLPPTQCLPWTALFIQQFLSSPHWVPGTCANAGDMRVNRQE